MRREPSSHRLLKICSRSIRCTISFEETLAAKQPFLGPPLASLGRRGLHKTPCNEREHEI